jgi:outer membrane lipoprotein-sorting protein
MKRVRTGFFLVAMLLFQVVPAPGQEAGKSVRSVEADFVQKKELAILARPLVSRGKFFFQSPDSLRWEYTEPVRSVLLLHGGETSKFVKENGQMREVRSMAGQGLALILTEMTGWLDGDFSDTDTFTVQRTRGKNLIRLIPRKPGLQKIINEIDLVPGNQPGLLRSVTIVEGRDATTILTFHHVRLNQPLAPRLFTRP